MTDSRNRTFSDDSLHIPAFPTWTAALDVQAFLPYTSQPQQIPSDIPKFDETLWAEQLPLLDILDRTSLEASFDPSCLDSLDDQLLLSPTDSFADVCWAEAVYDCCDRPATPTQLRINTLFGSPTSLGRRQPDDSAESWASQSDDDPTTPTFDKGEMSYEPAVADSYPVSYIADV